MTGIEAPANAQFVGVHGGLVCVRLVRSTMTPRQALEHAAWLVAIAELEIQRTGLGDVVPSFPALLAAVRST